MSGEFRRVAENQNWEPYFAYLDGLRDSGVTNMFGACPYLVEEFHLEKKLASKILAAWMNQIEGSKNDS